MTQNKKVDELHDKLYPGGADGHPVAGVRYMLLCRVVIGYGEGILREWVTCGVPPQPQLMETALLGTVVSTN